MAYSPVMAVPHPMPAPHSLIILLQATWVVPTVPDRGTLPLHTCFFFFFFFFRDPLLLHFPCLLVLLFPARAGRQGPVEFPRTYLMPVIAILEGTISALCLSSFCL